MPSDDETNEEQKRKKDCRIADLHIEKHRRDARQDADCKRRQNRADEEVAQGVCTDEKIVQEFALTHETRAHGEERGGAVVEMQADVREPRKGEAVR